MELTEYQSKVSSILRVWCPLPNTLVKLIDEILGLAKTFVNQQDKDGGFWFHVSIAFSQLIVSISEDEKEEETKLEFTPHFHELQKEIVSSLKPLIAGEQCHHFRILFHRKCQTLVSTPMELNFLLSTRHSEHGEEEFYQDCETGLLTKNESFSPADIAMSILLNFHHLSFAVSRITVNSVSSPYFARKWINEVGGHGYRRAREWLLTTQKEDFVVITQRETSSFNCYIQKYWKERQEFDEIYRCRLHLNCGCDECARDCHRDCSSDLCQFLENSDSCCPCLLEDDDE